MKRVAIALGSNLGDRTKNLASALKRLQTEYGDQISVEKVSRLYESAPQYVTEQPAFLNAAAEIKTMLSPLSLLSVLKSVERDLGRSFAADQTRWGPRPIDLDIIFYEEDQVLEEDGRLIVPHPRWQERDFVKAPLADLTPTMTSAVPRGLDKFLVAAKTLWNEQGGEKALKRYSEDSVLSCVLPVGPQATWGWSHQTSVMGILNVTPDSFSDGGQHVNVDQAISAAFDMVRDGADIIDIGGQSTRPGAIQIEPDEEWQRVEPVIRAIRSEPSLQSVPISIDTFYSQVAEKAVAAGANIVNDVSGGTADSKMFGTVADMDVAYILMHMRGNPRTMQNKENVQYDDVCKDVAAALEASCQAAVEAGIESWRIVLDPGIGFAKNYEGNLDLVAHLPRLRSCIAEPFKNLPILLGPSRKKFLGTLVERENGPPVERDWATCAISAISAMKGASIIRAHNVRATKDATMVSDGIMKHIL